MCDEILLRSNLVTAVQLGVARSLQAREGGALTECLVRIDAVDETALVEALASALFLPTATTAELAAVDADLMKLLPAELIIELRVVPIAVDGDLLTVAFADPSDERAVAEVAFFAGQDIARAVAPPTGIRAVLERMFGIRVLSQLRPIASRVALAASR